MSPTAIEESVLSEYVPAGAPEPVNRHWQRLLNAVGPAVPWNSATQLGLVALLVLWAVRFYATWATWGSLTIDCGREVYVPAMLAEGKTLYRDLWYPYPPLAPYFNSYLFRWFGVHLNVV